MNGVGFLILRFTELERAVNGALTSAGTHGTKRNQMASNTRGVGRGANMTFVSAGLLPRQKRGWELEGGKCLEYK